ncbi:dihydroorotase [Desulforegula conservatrix]|uniref:dihydroorotase n=1 Tax=Desulforegula conservatrix TaxID=153026 RepID=UPI0004885677|nr:dihydroorotase [Desulforegula conservatrix]
MLTKISGGHVIDPGYINARMDIWIKDGSIFEVCEEGKGTLESSSPDRIINAAGKIVVPGLIDMHVHLREPGHEYKETIETGLKAAVAGGFTAVCCMPNTKPVNDNAQITSFILEKARQAGLAKVYPVAAISLGLKGDSLAEYAELKTAGAIAVSDDGMPVSSGRLMRNAMEYASCFGLLTIAHCEDHELACNGCMNEGSVSTRLGLRGIPNISESIMVMRDIELSDLTGVPVHIAHVSARESVNAIREGKKRGIKVTAETAPHYFTLTDEAVGNYDTNAKMNPPLRTETDRLAVIKGLEDGTLDIIATDHAPHSVLEKELEFDKAANGICGLETSLGLSMKLVHDGIIGMESLVRLMSTRPAEILGKDNHLKPGNNADIAIIDPDAEWKVDSSKFQGKSKNTPFNGWDLKGRAVMTIVDGRIVFEL